MKKKTSDKTWIGYTAGLILLLITFFFTFYQSKKLSLYTANVKRNSGLMNKLDVLLINAKNLETRYRQYILVKKETVRSSFDSALTVIEKDLDDLSVYESSSSSSVKNLRFLFSDFAATARDGMSYYRSVTYIMTPEVMGYSMHVLNKMERISNTIINIHEEESKRLDNSYYNLEVATTTVNYINIILFITAICLLVYSVVTYMKEYKARQTANAKSEAYAIELEKRVEELAAANKQLSELKSIEKFASTGRIARTIAHEVRNPLTNINLAADQLKELLQEHNADADLLIAMMLRNSNRINQLISDLLNSTKFPELNLQPYSVNRLLDEALEMAKDRIKLQGVQVIKNYNADCVIQMDPEKMKIAALNLIVNAIEAMVSNEGVLTVTTYSSADKCSFSVSDNGSGIETDMLNRLFEPYFTSKTKGSGLGLTNTQNIIYTHKGTIEVLSEKGKGTTFTVSLSK